MIVVQQRILDIRKAPQNVSGLSRSGITELPGLFTVGFLLSYLKGFLSTLATIEVPPLLDNALLLAGLSFLILHLIANAQVLEKKIIPCFAILVLMAVCYVLSSDSSPFFACLVFFCAISLADVRPLIKLWFWVTCFLVAFNSLVYGLQVVAGSAEVFYRFEEGSSAVRFGLGFVHPNMAGAFLFWLCGCGLYLHYGKQTVLDYVVVEAVAIFVIIVVDSRTSGYLTSVLPFAFYIQSRWRLFTRNRAIRFVFGLLPLVLFLVTFAMAGPLYDANIGESFTGRPWLWHACLESQGLTIFGQEFQDARAVGFGGFTWVATTLDSFYANGLMVSGLLFSSLFCAMYFKRCRRDDRVLEAAMPFLVLVLLFGFTEGHLLDICFGFPLIMICSTGFSLLKR